MSKYKNLLWYTWYDYHVHILWYFKEYHGACLKTQQYLVLFCQCHILNHVSPLLLTVNAVKLYFDIVKRV